MPKELKNKKEEHKKEKVSTVKNREYKKAKAYADMIRDISRYRSIVMRKPEDLLWFIGFDRKRTVPFISLVLDNCNKIDDLKIYESLRVCINKDISYAVLSTYSSYALLGIKDKWLNTISDVLMCAEKCKINIDDYLVVSKDSFISFSALGKMDNLKNKVKEIILYEKESTKKIIEDVKLDMKNNTDLPFKLRKI